MEQKSIESKAQIFMEMVNEDHIYLCRELDYQTVCCMLDVKPQDLDASLQGSIGHGGEELMGLMKKGYLSYIGKKYGLSIGNPQLNY